GNQIRQRRGRGDAGIPDSDAGKGRSFGKRLSDPPAGLACVTPEKKERLFVPDFLAVDAGRRGAQLAEEALFEWEFSGDAADAVRAEENGGCRHSTTSGQTSPLPDVGGGGVTPSPSTSRKSKRGSP